MLATQSQDKLKNDVIIIITCNHEIIVIIIERARIEKILLNLQKMEYFESEGEWTAQMRKCMVEKVEGPSNDLIFYRTNCLL